MAICLIGLVGMLPGCNLIEGAAVVLSPPEKIDAKHDLADKPTLIVVDDPLDQVNNEALLRRIAGGARAALEAEGVVATGFVGQDELAGYRDELGDTYATTSLAGLGVTLGARQVIHAEVVGYQLNVDDRVYRPSMTLAVKVFDLDQRERVFPPVLDPETGADAGVTVYTMRTRMDARDLGGQGQAARSIVSRELADTVGRDLGRLFFDWRVPEVGSTLEKK